MSIVTRVDGIWYGRRSGGALSLLLGALALLYRLLSGIRAGLYRSGVKKRRKLPVPFISVGNIVVGGSGKTPLVSWIVSRLQDEGRRPAVISRGYGGSEKGPLRVDPGKGAAARFGDEPAMIARSHPGLPVVVARDRWKAGNEAVGRWNADIVVADDAFQHLRLERDLDIVAVDGRRWFGNGRLFPAGPLREDLGSLARADVVVIKGKGEGPEEVEKEALLGRLAPQALIVEAVLRPAGWRLSGEVGPVVGKPPEPVFPISGLADPGTFGATLDEMGIRRLEGRSFPDHHTFSEREMLDVDSAAAASGALAVATTEKDAERTGEWPGRLPLYILEVRVEIGRGGRELEGKLKSLRGKEGK